MSEEREEEIAALEAEHAGNPKWEQAVFGREVEAFIETDPVGRYLVTRARETLEEAKEELIECDPSDTRKLIEIQIRARAARLVRDFLGQAVTDGRDAETLLQQERDDA